MDRQEVGRGSWRWRKGMTLEVALVGSKQTQYGRQRQPVSSALSALVRAREIAVFELILRTRETKCCVLRR